MFMCKHCLNQFEDSELAYTLILESRLHHPMAESFVMRFCSLHHVQEFLRSVIGNQQTRYVLTRKGPRGEKQFEPNTPDQLLLLVGSSKG